MAREQKAAGFELDETRQGARIDELIEEEWKEFILNMALDNISKLFSGQAFEVFRLSLEGVSNEEIAERLSLKRQSVKVLKSRVRSRCVEEIKRLLRDYDGNPQ